MKNLLIFIAVLLMFSSCTPPMEEVTPRPHIEVEIDGRTVTLTTDFEVVDSWGFEKNHKGNKCRLVTGLITEPTEHSRGSYTVTYKVSGEFDYLSVHLRGYVDQKMHLFSYDIQTN